MLVPRLDVSVRTSAEETSDEGEPAGPRCASRAVAEGVRKPSQVGATM